MIQITGTVDKIMIGEKKEGDIAVPVLTVTLIVPIKGSQTVNDLFSVFKEKANISFIKTQGSLDLGLGESEPQGKGPDSKESDGETAEGKESKPEGEKPEEEKPEGEKPEDEKPESKSKKGAQSD